MYFLKKGIVIQLLNDMIKHIIDFKRKQTQQKLNQLIVTKIN